MKDWMENKRRYHNKGRLKNKFSDGLCLKQIRQAGNPFKRSFSDGLSIFPRF